MLIGYQKISYSDEFYSLMDILKNSKEFNNKDKIIMTQNDEN